MTIEIVKDKISLDKVRALAEETYSIMIKGVADLERKIVALGGEMHSDAEQILLKDGSRQQNLWGFNVLLDKPNIFDIEYHSLINIRPKDGNMTMEIEDAQICNKIKEIVLSLISI